MYHQRWGEPRLCSCRGRAVGEELGRKGGEGNYGLACSLLIELIANRGSPDRKPPNLSNAAPAPPCGCKGGLA